VFFTASYGPFLRSMVSTDHRMEANAKLEGSVWAAQMAGPGLGGLAAQLLGAVSGLFANALSFLVSAACLTRIRVAEPAPQPREEHASVRAEINEGIRFLVRDPRLRVVIAYMGAGNFGDSMLEAVVIVFLVRTVHVHPGLAGVLVATLGIGGVSGTMLAARIGLRLGTARNAALHRAYLSVHAARPGHQPGRGTGAVRGRHDRLWDRRVGHQRHRRDLCPGLCARRLLGCYSGTANLVIRGTQPLGAVTGAVAGEAFGPRAAM
jgi:Major Facilitator Superfamily